MRAVIGNVVPKRIATHVLCIMARGLVKHIDCPMDILVHVDLSVISCIHIVAGNWSSGDG